MTNETTAPDLIERLRFCGKLHPKVGYPENGKLFNEAADALEAAQARIAELEGALKRVMVGGNHLALIIGDDHPPFDAGVTWAMNVYGASTDKYNAWCCWSDIMKARAALEGKG